MLCPGGMSMNNNKKNKNNNENNNKTVFGLFMAHTQQQIIYCVKWLDDCLINWYRCGRRWS